MALKLTSLNKVKRSFQDCGMYNTKEIINPKTQTKHVLKIDALTNTLLRNDFYVKDKTGDYKLSSQRIFGYKTVSTIIKDLLTGDTKERKFESLIPTKRYIKRIIANPDRTKIKDITIDKEHGVEVQSYYLNGKLTHTNKIEQVENPLSFSQKIANLKYKLDYYLREAFLF